jgi:hypothetical protein
MTAAVDEHPQVFVVVVHESLEHSTVELAHDPTSTLSRLPSTNTL